MTTKQGLFFFLTLALALNLLVWFLTGPDRTELDLSQHTIEQLERRNRSLKQELVKRDSSIARLKRKEDELRDRIGIQHKIIKHFKTNEHEAIQRIYHMDYHDLYLFFAKLDSASNHQ